MFAFRAKVKDITRLGPAAKASETAAAASMGNLGLTPSYGRRSAKVELNADGIIEFAVGCGRNAMENGGQARKLISSCLLTKVAARKESSAAPNVLPLNDNTFWKHFVLESNLGNCFRQPR